MSDPNADDAPRSDRTDPLPKLRFVSARPDTNQARREARAAIRAHASQASWAKLKKQGKHAHAKANSPVTSDHAELQHRQRRISLTTGEPASTGLVSTSNDRLARQDSSGSASSSPRQLGPSRAARRAILESARVPSPLRTVGAGDIDPFSSYPSRLPKEVVAPIFEQVHNFLNIMFLPEPDRPHQGIVQQWVTWYTSDSTLFHAVLFAQLARWAAVEPGLTAVYRKAYWYCYNEVVREINRRFNEPSQRCSDENLHAVQALAFHGDRTSPQPDISVSPSQGPMNSMQGLDLYTGPLYPVTMHVNGLARMLSLRGGLAGIQCPGLAAMLSYGDVLLASQLLQKPAYAFVALGESPERTLAAVSRSEHPLAQLGSGFRVLHDLLSGDLAQRLHSMLQDLATYSLAVDDYIMGRPQAMSLGTLADQRNYVQHSLMMMSSPPNDGGDDVADGTFLLKDACWAAGAIYSLIAVFPIPRSRAPFARLASQLKQHLVYTSAHFARRWHTPSPLVLWMTFMGGLACTANDESKDDKIWYTTVLERLVHRMQITDWERLKAELLRFLWFPSTSDTDGQQLWKEIHTSNPFA